MKLQLLIYIILFSIPNLANAQQTDTLVKKLDSLSKETVDEGGQTNIIAPKAYNETTKITFKTYLVLLGSDFKQQLLTPFTLDKKGWTQTAGLAALTAGIMFVDKPIQKFAVRHRKYQAVTDLSKYITNTGGVYETYTLAALGAYGFLFKNEKIKTTTYLATQSYITAGLIGTLIKTLSGRERPSSYNPDHVGSSMRFNGPFAPTGKDVNGKRLNGSFPSGHTTVAFAAATVYAKEYADKPIVPIIAYTGATLIGLSRITENRHWTSDVFVGAALGYFCGKQVVNNYHRYAKIENDKVRKQHVSLNFNMYDGIMMPGLVYRP